MKKKKIKEKTDSGFTLVEVIVATVILLAVTLSSISYFYFGGRQDIDAKRQEYALQIAEDRIEEWRALTSVYEIPYISTNDSLSRYGTDFDWQFSARTPHELPLDEKYQVIIVTVSWTVDGHEQSVNLKSIVHPQRK